MGTSLNSLHELAEQRAVERRGKRRRKGGESDAASSIDQAEKKKRKRRDRGTVRGEEDSQSTASDVDYEAGVEEEGATEGGDKGGLPLPRLTREDRTGPKAAVTRQLPDWIQHPTLVEADITDHSLPLEETALPNRICRNLRRMGVVKLFPIQVSLPALRPQST